MALAQAWFGVGSAIVDGVLVEPLAATGYTRAAVLVEVLGGLVNIPNGVTLAGLVTPWGSMGACGLFDAATDGNMLYSAAIPAVPVAAMQLLTLRPGLYGFGGAVSPGTDVLTINGVPVTFLGDPLRGI